MFSLTISHVAYCGSCDNFTVWTVTIRSVVYMAGNFLITDTTYGP